MNPLGALLIWPFLFIVPGWVVVRRVAPDLPTPATVGVAVIASIYGSAHLVDVVARITGFGFAAVAISAALLAAGSMAVAVVRHRWLAPLRPPTPGGVLATLREDRAAWLIALAFGALVGGVLFANGWHETADGWVSGGWDWSDLLVHVSIGSSIMAGNFPPQVPYFAGVPLTYHWFGDFHGAIVAVAGGVPLIPVDFATSAVLAGTFALLVWSLTVRITGDRRVATIATLLICIGGGLGWLRLVGDVAGGNLDIGGLISQNPYDNDWRDGWPFFRIASVLGTGFFPHRATTFGLPGLVAVVLLVTTSLDRRPAGVLLAGVLAAMLAPFQFYAFPATYLIVGLYVLLSGAWRARTVVRDAALFLAPVVIALPFVLGPIAQQQANGAFRLVDGWSEARFGLGPAAVVFFYGTNLGIPFALALVGMFRRDGPPGRWFLAAWVAALFLIPNVVVFSAVDFDMNKYFQIMWVGVGMLAAWVIRRWSTVAIAGVVAVCAISPLLVAAWHLTNPAVVMSVAQERAAEWIAANTEDRAVFVTDAFINSPVDLGGRLRVTSFGPYVSNLGYDPTAREADVHTAYCGGPDAAARVMARYGARYVLSSGTNLDCGGGAPTDFDTSRRFTRVYDGDGVEVWKLRG